MSQNFNKNLLHRYPLRNLRELSYVVNFGRYNGKTLKYVFHNDKSYFDWFYRTSKGDNSFSDKAIENFNQIYTRLIRC